jgi:hypothetical protein
LSSALIVGYFGFKVARDLCAHGVSCSVESECKL